jgi:hypothetical protein
MENSLSGDDTEISCGFDKQNNWNFFFKNVFSRLLLIDWAIFAVFLGLGQRFGVEGDDVVPHLSGQVRAEGMQQVRVIDGEEQLRDNLELINYFR